MKRSRPAATPAGPGLVTPGPQTPLEPPGGWSKPEVLACGIDTLELGFYGPVRGDMAELLDMLQEEARFVTKDKRERRALPHVELDKWIFAVGSHAPSGSSWWLQSDEYRIQIADVPAEKAKTTPSLRFVIQAEHLWRVGPDRAVEIAQEMASQLIVTDGVPLVSRIDICCDVVGQAPDPNFYAWVTRAVRRAWYRTRRDTPVRVTADVKLAQDELGGVGRAKGLNFTGWAFGFGGDTWAVIYDKLEEMRSTGDDFMVQRYPRKLGADEVLTRNEIRFRRRSLSKIVAPRGAPNEGELMGTWTALRPALGALYAYGFESWLSHRDVARITRRERAPYSDAWRAVVDAPGSTTASNVEMCVQSPCLRLAPADGRVERLQLMAAGCILNAGEKLRLPVELMKDAPALAAFMATQAERLQAKTDRPWQDRVDELLADANKHTHFRPWEQ